MPASLTKGLVVALSCLLAVPVEAQTRCPPMAGSSGALDDVDAEARLTFIQQRMQHDARRARMWAWSWAGAYSGLVVANGIRIGFASGRDDLIDTTLATAASSIGLIALAALPLKVMRDQRALDALIAAPPEGGDRCALLAEAERLLLRDAASEALGKSFVVHAGSFVFNVGLGLLLGAGFGHWTQGTIVSFTGIAVGEVQTFTQPTDAIDSLSRYRAGQLYPATERRASSLTLVPIVAPGLAGFQIGARF